MLVGIKSTSKLIGISIIACCAVLVCTMFLNFYFDVRMVESEITSELSMVFYRAQVSTAKVVCLVSGGCLLFTSVVMLLFYIKHYIDTHKKELAILGGYRPLSYIGFGIGTVYQYGLLRIMVDIVFQDVEGVPAYQFDFPVMFISLVCFLTVYEILMYVYSEKIKQISIKEIMIE